MKGSLHTDELMHEVMRRESRLRTERRISHAYVMLLVSSAKPLILSDCAINIAPTLEDKVDIVQNAIDLAIALGIALPKVALLSAVETVTSRIPSARSTPPCCARWPSAARSEVGCSTDRLPSTTRSASRRR